jgi:hypothetical protein
MPEGIINFYNWVAETTAMLMKTSPLTGISFAVFMFAFCIGTPLIVLFGLAGGLRARSVLNGDSGTGYRKTEEEETRSALQSRSGRFLCFFLAASLFAAAWVIQTDREPGSGNIILVLGGFGAASMLAGFFPGPAAAILEKLSEFLPRRRW